LANVVADLIVWGNRLGAADFIVLVNSLGADDNIVWGNSALLGETVKTAKNRGLSKKGAR
jgi:hypothetical protein